MFNFFTLLRQSLFFAVLKIYQIKIVCCYTLTLKVEKHFNKLQATEKLLSTVAHPANSTNLVSESLVDLTDLISCL